MKKTAYRKLALEVFGLTEKSAGSSVKPGAPIAVNPEQPPAEPRTVPMGGPSPQKQVGNEPNPHEDEYEKDIEKMDQPEVEGAHSRLGQFIVKAFGMPTAESVKESFGLMYRNLKSNAKEKKEFPTDDSRSKWIETHDDDIMVLAYTDESVRMMEAVSKMQDCPRCGKTVTEPDTKCSKCGKKVVWESITEDDTPPLSGKGGANVPTDATNSKFPTSELSPEDVKAVDGHEKDILAFAKKAFGTKPLGIALKLLRQRLGQLGVSDDNCSKIADLLAHMYHMDASPETHIFQKVLPRIAQIPNVKGGGFYSGGSPGPWQPLG